MKFKTTRKRVVEQSTKIVSAGYCDLAHLLTNRSPIAYTSGVYGWNFDVYEVDGLTICTGYCGMPGRAANNIAEYEKKAREIFEDYRRAWDERMADIDNLLREFVKQA